MVSYLLLLVCDPFDDGQLELGSCSPDAVGDQLGLERVDKALGHGVVLGIADRSDRGKDAVSSRTWEKAMLVYWLPASL